MTGIGVVGTGSYLPEQIISNEMIAPRAGVDAAWIARKTGILSRRRATEDQASSDLAVAAAQRALHSAGIEAAQLDYVVVATSTPDHPQPATANLVQAAIGARTAGAFDVNAVCSGFIYALSVTESLLRVRPHSGYGLVVGVDIYSRILDYTDRRTAVLFGDGAGAVVLGPCAPGAGLLGTRLRSHGNFNELIQVPAGGSRIPPSVESLARGDHFFKMQGRGVREFVAQELPPAVFGLLGQVGRAAHEVKHIIPHQANLRMLEELQPEFGLTGAQMHLTVESYGNTGAASVPITLDEAYRSGRLEVGDLVMLAAFGGGMNIGATLCMWSMVPAEERARPAAAARPSDVGKELIGA